MIVPRWIVALAGALVLSALAWTIAVANDRNPLPFPDGSYPVFTTPSPEAKSVVIGLLETHGMKPRFRMDTEGVERAIFWDGTIVNYSQPEMFERVGRPGAAIGLVVRDPAAAALDAVHHLRTHGFQAAMIEGAEPGLPIVFVTTDALNGSVLVFRKHRLKMGRPPARWR